MLILWLCVVCALGQYSGPFTQISVSGFSGTADINSREGPEDHVVSCQGKLVFLFINKSDSSVSTYSSTDGGKNWEINTPDTGGPCNDGTNLTNRDSGFSMGVAVDPNTGMERVLVLGGDDTEKNLFVSDDCGETFHCVQNQDGNKAWTPRRYTYVGAAPWNTTGPHTLLLGGLSVGDIQGRGTFESFDMGSHWDRPFCTGANNGSQGGCNYGRCVSNEYVVFNLLCSSLSSPHFHPNHFHTYVTFFQQ